MKGIVVDSLTRGTSTIPPQIFETVARFTSYLTPFYERNSISDPFFGGMTGSFLFFLAFSTSLRPIYRAADPNVRVVCWFVRQRRSRQEQVVPGR